ncbi:MAG: phenylacetic acid degradation protein PaaN [Acidimicrobiia bacterium]|nr:phenylacetic acid degradation protein PaaN [Acidimicrobiia bacterium]
MPDALYEKHKDTLTRARKTIASREYWSPYPESPRAYGEEAPSRGEQAFESRLGKRFALDQAAHDWSSGGETSAYGRELGVVYPATSVASLLDNAAEAAAQWGKAPIRHRSGVCMEILHRLSQNSFEMAHAVMQTTGQSFLMAFQAGGPHALDRGLEAVAYAHDAAVSLPSHMQWEKPQGKRDPIVLNKTWRLRPAGIAVTIGVSTFPTWNGYPGIFASLATGNPVIVKPHPATILPLALFVEIARGVLSDAGFDPNVVQLAVDTPSSPIAKDLAMDPRVKLVDYTGGSAFGDWLEANVSHAEVFTEKAGVNSVILDSAEDLKGVFRNLSVSMTMYSGQMCTTPQNVYIPKSGMRVAGEEVSYEEVVAGFTGAIAGLLSDDDRASDILGAIKDAASIERLESATTSGDVILDAREIKNPLFPDAIVRTPVVVAVDASDKDAYMREMFGPVIYVIATDSTKQSLELATESAATQGAITWLVYSTDSAVQDAAEDAAVEAGVSVAFNLTGGLFVNQSAAFSDFHVTGANPAGNASLTDPAFIAKRFRVIGVRKPA